MPPPPVTSHLPCYNSCSGTPLHHAQLPPAPPSGSSHSYLYLCSIFSTSFLTSLSTYLPLPLIKPRPPTSALGACSWLFCGLCPLATKAGQELCGQPLGNATLGSRNLEFPPECASAFPGQASTALLRECESGDRNHWATFEGALACEK